MWNQREWKEMYLYHHKKAEAGNVESQFELGKFHEYGRGVVKNTELAEFWYLKAAEQKHPLALLNLNWMRLKESDDTQRKNCSNVKTSRKCHCKQRRTYCRCPIIPSNPSIVNDVLIVFK